MHKEEKVLSVTIINKSGYTLPTSTIKSFVHWRQNQVGGLEGKTIMIYVHKKIGNILGNAYVGGQEIWLYVEAKTSTHKMLITLAHELQHLMGAHHGSEMPSDEYFDSIVTRFGA